MLWCSNQMQFNRHLTDVKVTINAWTSRLHPPGSAWTTVDAELSEHLFCFNISLIRISEGRHQKVFYPSATLCMKQGWPAITGKLFYLSEEAHLWLSKQYEYCRIPLSCCNPVRFMKLQSIIFGINAFIPAHIWPYSFQHRWLFSRQTLKQERFFPFSVNL